MKKFAIPNGSACVLFLMFCLSTAANAVDWLPIAKTSKLIVSIDADTLIRVDGITKGWVRTVFLDNEKWSETIAFQHFNCRERSFKVLALQIYFHDGSSKDEEVPNQNKWHYPPPESAAESIMNLVCSL